MSGFPDIAQTALFLEAAAEAREASRRYWALGGHADRKYARQPCPDWWWPAQSSLAPANDDLRELRRRRRERR